MGLGRSLKSSALGAAKRGLERLMQDPARAQRVAKVIGAAQKGQKALERRQEDVMALLSIASKREYQQLSKRLAALKRRVRSLEERLPGG
jgi:polyhydroxyalkanoate synthesis regulator phasin